MSMLLTLSLALLWTGIESFNFGQDTLSESKEGNAATSADWGTLFTLAKAFAVGEADTEDLEDLGEEELKDVADAMLTYLFDNGDSDVRDCQPMDYVYGAISLTAFAVCSNIASDFFDALMNGGFDEDFVLDFMREYGETFIKDPTTQCSCIGELELALPDCGEYHPIVELFEIVEPVCDFNAACPIADEVNGADGASYSEICRDMSDCFLQFWDTLESEGDMKSLKPTVQQFEQTPLQMYQDVCDMIEQFSGDGPKGCKLSGKDGCFEYDCDYWLDFGYTCDMLEGSLIGCDCTGCFCS